MLWGGHHGAGALIMHATLRPRLFYYWTRNAYFPATRSAASFAALKVPQPVAIS